MRGGANRHWWDESVAGHVVGGATWVSYNQNQSGGMQWARPGGDWLDRDGVLHGPKPWAERLIKAGTGGVQEFDVTELVLKWLSGEEAQGFLVRSDGTAKWSYSSREGDVPPELVINDTTLYATKDTSLSPSTAKPMGHTGTLESATALIRFDGIADVTGPVESAMLRLHVVRPSGYGQSIVRIDEATTVPWRAPHDPGGLAKAYPNDAGLVDHPSVYVVDAMDGDGYSNLWTRVDMAEPPAESIALISGGEMRACYGRSGVCSITGDRINGGQCRIEFAFADAGLEEPDHVFTRAMVSLPPEMRGWEEGGKVPTGVISNYLGTPYQGGNSGVPSNGSNGWSARGGYGLAYQAPNNVLHGYTTLHAYLYHMDQIGLYGDTGTYGDPYLAAVPPSEWYCVEMEVKINDVEPDGRAVPNGVVRAWINDYLVYARTDFRFSALPFTAGRGIERVYDRAFSGGIKRVKQDARFLVDNYVIAAERIGCPVFEVNE